MWTSGHIILLPSSMLCHIWYYALCTGVVLGYNITHTTEFDYDHIDLRFASTETITKMVSLP